MFKDLNLKGFSFKSTFVLVALFIMLFASHSVLCAWDWATGAGGTGDEGYIQSDFAVDTNGNIYITGSFENSVTFGDTTLTSNGGKDIFVAKMDANGNWLWAVSAGGTTNTGDYDEGRGITVDGDGNVYITGGFGGTVDFGSTQLTGSSSVYTPPGETIYVAKLDTDGTWLWAQKAGAWHGDWGYDLVVDSSGNCYVTGTFFSYAIFGAYTVYVDNFAWQMPPPISIPTNASDHGDIFVAKIDTDGNWLWVESAGGFSDTGSDNDQGCVIAFDPSGNLGIAGNFGGTAYFGSDSLVSNGSYDVFVAKMDTDGNWLGEAGAGGEGIDECWNGLDFDTNGNAYITGSFHSPATFGAINLNLTGTGGNDIFVAKLATNNEWQWARGVGALGNDIGYGLVADGNIYITGSFENTVSFGTTPLISAGGTDVFAANIDAAGTWQGAIRAGGSPNEEAWSIALYDVYFYIYGSYEGTTSFGEIELTNAGENDIYVAKELLSTLPVELSAFTALFTDNQLLLSWQTQSETDNLGWNIYRNDEEDFSTSIILTDEIIPGNGTTTEPSYYNYTDEANLTIGETYYYWLESIDYSGTSKVYTRAEITIPDPSTTPHSIEPPIVYNVKSIPNPINTNAQFKFTLDKEAVVSVSIYNIKGELVKTLPSIIAQENETESICWNGKDNSGRDLASGIYFYNLLVNHKVAETNKLILMK